MVVRKLMIAWAIAWMLGTFTLIPVPPTQAETYIAGQFGATFPQKFEEVRITSAGFTNLSVSNIDLENSFVYGAKIGHYFSSIPWLGVESEIFLTNPNVKQQSLVFSGPGGSITIPGVAGFNLRVINLAPLNVMFRVPGYRLQPYIGAGAAILLARLQDKVTQDKQTSTRFGINALAGIRFYITKNWTVFAEGKFTGLTTFKFKETANLDGFNAKYNAIHTLAGIGWHF